MPFHKNSIALLCTLMSAVVFSPLAVSGVADLKLKGSVKGYNLIEDSITSSQSNPGFVTNSLGSDNYSPKISLNGSRGKPAAIDLTNGTGSPAINLSRTNGYNTNIASLSSAEPWKSVWSGSSTGRIAIPRHAKEVFVKYKKGSTYSSAAFPVNAGTVTIDSISKNWTSNSSNHDRSCSATATARYSNYNVSGQFARGSYSQCDVAIYITKVMYR